MIAGLVFNITIVMMTGPNKTIQTSKKYTKETVRRTGHENYFFYPVVKKRNMKYLKEDKSMIDITANSIQYFKKFVLTKITRRMEV